MARYAIQSSSPSMLAASWIDDNGIDASSMERSTTSISRHLSLHVLLPGSRFWFILSQCGALFILALGVIVALLVYDYGRYKLRSYYYHRLRQQRQAAKRRQPSFDRDQLWAFLPVGSAKGCCAICLDDESEETPQHANSTSLSSGASTRTWTQGQLCGHGFHMQCMVDYAQIRLQCQPILDCPICRQCFVQLPARSSEQSTCSSSWLA